MSRLAVLLATLVLGSVLLGVASTPAAGAQIAITNVTATPDRPAAGEVVTVRATLRNSADSADAFEVTNVVLREIEPTLQQRARVQDLGTVAPGETIQLPLTTTFDSPGVKELRVVVSGRDESQQSQTRQYPVTVIVTDRGPQLAVDAVEPVVGEQTTVNVTVSNGGGDAIRQLDVRLAGEGVRIDAARRLVAELPAGEDREFAYEATFPAASEVVLNATARYQTASGQTRAIARTERVTVEPLVEDVGVEARVGEGAQPPVLLDVTNFGNARLEAVQVRLLAGDRTVARRAVADVSAGAERTIRVNVSGVRDATLAATLAYETGGRAGSVSTDVRYVAQPGRVRITGVDFDREGETTVISGSASNVGLADVESVVVRVLPAAGVEPVPPNREYFVGTVPASDFVSFDLTARVDANVTAVPVEVTYLADGVEHTETVAVSYSAPPVEPTDRGAGGGMGLLVPALLGLLVVAAAGVYWWRRRDGG